MGNDLALDNISFRPCGPDAFILPLETNDICLDGAPVILDATVVGAAYDTLAFQWQLSTDGGENWTNIPGETGTSFTHTNLSTGHYHYRFLLANGLTNIANSKCRVVSNEKIVHVMPKFYDLIDTICEGMTYTVGQSAYSQSGNYEDSLISSVGCDSIVRLDLYVAADQGMYAEFSHSNPTCSYYDDGFFMVDTVYFGRPPLSLIFDNQEYEIQHIFNDLAAGQYAYSIHDRYGCTIQDILTIESPAELVVDLGEDWELELGEAIQITPVISDPSSELLWDPEGLECPAPCQELVWIPTHSSPVSLTATNHNNCVASDSVFVSVHSVRKLFIPNAFTPNGDGLNDVFHVVAETPNVQEITSMQIYNSWGTLLYENRHFNPNDQNSGWNGDFKGQAAPMGVYLYHINVVFLDAEQIQYQGYVTLLR